MTHLTLSELNLQVYESELLFDRVFSTNIHTGILTEKLFREQLAFHKDIDYTEPVEFLVPAPSEEEIRQFLIDRAIDLES